MGNICPCIFKKKSNTQKSGPYDAHQIFEIQQNLGPVQGGTSQHFHTLVQQPPNSGKSITKQSLHKSVDAETSNKSNQERAGSKPSSKISSNDNTQQFNMIHKHSTQSLIRKRMQSSMSQQTEDQSLQNLQKSFKVITQIHSKQINIKTCRKSKIYIFDISNTINIQNCSDCIIFCAPCSGKITVTNCKQMKLILISAKLEIVKSKYCEISLFCSSFPRISRSSEICFSNFLRFGYYDLIQQFDSCNLEVWNNKFLEVEDIDQNPDQEHYSQKKIHTFDIDWEAIFEQGRIQSADPSIPLFWKDMRQHKNRQILVLNQPMRQIEQKLLKNIISNNIGLHKAYKGILSIKCFQKIKRIFPHHQQNQYLCILIGKQLQSSGFQAYFQSITGRQMQQIQKQLFPSIDKQ